MPANQVETFTVTVPAGTPKATPVSVATAIPQGAVIGLDLIIPDGHAGLTGIQLYVAGGLALPTTIGQWISGNNDVIKIPLAGLPETGAWSAKAYNLGKYAHSFLLRFYIDNLAPYRQAQEEQRAPDPIPTPLLT